jgi:hypothetical protein
MPKRKRKKLIVEPAPVKSLLEVLARLAPLRERLPRVRDLPPDDVDFGRG